MTDPFQTTANFGNLAGSAGSAFDFNNAHGFGTARQAPIGLNQFNSFNFGDRQANLLTLYPPSSQTSSHFGATPTLSLNQLMRGASNLQLNSDGSVKNLNGYDTITSVNPLGRLIDPRYFRFGLRFMF